MKQMIVLPIEDLDFMLEAAKNQGRVEGHLDGASGDAAADWLSLNALRLEAVKKSYEKETLRGDELSAVVSIVCLASEASSDPLGTIRECRMKLMKVDLVRMDRPHLWTRYLT